MSSMLRLTAPIDRPYRIAVDAAVDDGSLAVQITAPDTTTSSPALTVAGARHVASITPDQLGTHTIEITASDDPTIVGESFELIVSQLGEADLVFDHTTTETPCGEQLLRWPCPHLGALDCIDEYSPESVRRWMSIAAGKMYRDAAARFPGCHMYLRLRPKISGACLVPTPGGHHGFDLFETVRYPVLELLEVETEGTASDPADWTIEQQRWLVPADGVSWPVQDWDGDLAGPRTWSVLVRAGRRPPPLVVRARDMWALAMIIRTEPTTSGSMACRMPDGTTQLSENGRTMRLDPDIAGAALHAELVREWGAKPWDLSGIHDPAEPTARGSRTARVVPGDQTPTSHRLFLGSGCDLTAELAALAP
jgi:hypothetical protein